MYTPVQTDILKRRNKNVIEAKADTLQSKTDFMLSSSVGKR